MIGRAAVGHPWVLGEALARLTRGETVAPPTPDQRRALYRQLLAANIAARGPVFGVRVTRRHVPVVAPLLDEATRRALYVAPTEAEALALIEPGSAGTLAAASGV